MNLTNEYITTKERVDYGNGVKTVCVSTCLNYFNVPYDSYNYTSSKKNLFAYKNILRRNNYSVCSRMSEFGVKNKRTSLTVLKKTIKKSKYNSTDRFIVSVCTYTSAHLIVLDGDGNTIIDTAKGARWKDVRLVSLVK